MREVRVKTPNYACDLSGICSALYELGGLIVMHDAGAHCYAMRYNYNGRLRHAEVLLRAGGATELIRRRETPMDYFATLDVLLEAFANLAAESEGVTGIK